RLPLADARRPSGLPRLRRRPRAACSCNASLSAGTRRHADTAIRQNVSPRLVSRLADIFPGALHVAQVGLERATDLAVWEYARGIRSRASLRLVTKGVDFNDLSVLCGPPPKVIRLRLGG